MSEKVRVTAENGRRRRRSGVQVEACCVGDEQAAQNLLPLLPLRCNTMLQAALGAHRKTLPTSSRSSANAERYTAV